MSSVRVAGTVLCLLHTLLDIVVSDSEDFYPAALSLLQVQADKLHATDAHSSWIPTSVSHEALPSSDFGGVTAPLNQEGYKQVARSRSTALMASFVKMVIEANGGVVIDMNKLFRFVPYHSGERGLETFEHLLQEVKNVTWAHFEEDQAKKASLDQKGYLEVAALKDTDKMSEYIQRVIGANTGHVRDLRKLRWFAKYHSGEKAIQTYKQLVTQLRKQPWISGMAT